MVQSARAGAEELFKAFAEPVRLRLLCLLTAGETCVCDLVSAVRLPQPTVSRHLAQLRDAGLVSVRRDGNWAWYALAKPAGPLHAKLVEALGHCRDELPGARSDEARACRIRKDAESRCC